MTGHGSVRRLERLLLWRHGGVEDSRLEPLRHGIRGLVPGVPVVCRGGPIEEPDGLARRTEIEGHEGAVTAVDGGELIRAGTEAVARAVEPADLSVHVLHVILTDVVPMTREEGERRSHGRILLAANPAWISVTGLLEAPARPRAWYFARRFLEGEALKEVRSDLGDRMLDADDPRLAPVLAGCLGQVVLHWCAGTGFCDDPDCSLHNAHRQGDLLRAQGGWIEAWDLRDEEGFPEAVAAAYCERHRRRLEEIREASRSR